MKNKHSIFMNHALKIARSMLKNGYLPVGAVLVRDNKVISDNAFKRDEKNLHRLDHAEVVALRRLFKKNKDTNIGDVTLYCTFEPCLMCYSTSILSGVKKIVYAYEDAMGGGTSIDHKKLTPYYVERPIDITAHICRVESLTLFKKYFKHSDNGYAGTLLESYTLQSPE